MNTFSSWLLLIGMLAEAPPKPVVTVPAIKHKGDNAAAVAISADGALVAAAYGGPSTTRFPLEGTTGGVWVWDRKTGKPLYSLRDFGSILRVEFSRDGRYLAYTRIYTPGDSIHTARTALIDWKARKVVHHWEADCFAFDPTGDRILVGTSDHIRLIELATLKEQKTLGISSPRCLAVSPDGKQVAALGTFWQGRRGSPDGLYVFNLETGKAIVTRHGENLHKAQSLAFSPDGKELVSGHDGGEARRWPASDATAKPRLLTLDTPLALFPLFLDGGKTLGLVTQPANGLHWDYDRTDPSGFKVEKGKTPPWADLHRFEPEAAEPRPVLWRFQDAGYRTFYARFRTTRGTPEVNSRRYVLSSDGKTIVLGCNGCTLIDARTGKIEIRLEPKD